MSQKVFRVELEEAAEAGDLAEVCRLLERRLDPMVLLNGKDHAVPFNRLYRKALIKAGENDSRALTKHLILEILSIQALLLFRVGLHTRQEIDNWDKVTDNSYGSLPDVVVAEDLPRLSKLQQEVQATLKALNTIEKDMPPDGSHQPKPGSDSRSN